MLPGRKENIKPDPTFNCFYFSGVKIPSLIYTFMVYSSEVKRNLPQRIGKYITEIKDISVSYKLSKYRYKLKDFSNKNCKYEFRM